MSEEDLGSIADKLIEKAAEPGRSIEQNQQLIRQLGLALQSAMGLLEDMFEHCEELRRDLAELRSQCGRKVK